MICLGRTIYIEIFYYSNLIWKKKYFDLKYVGFEWFT